MENAEVMVAGGGPAGVCAALEAASFGASVLVVDSDLALGGQLVKQTHKFFGSKDEYAGTRGLGIAKILFDELEDFREKGRIQILSNTTAAGYFPDQGCVACLPASGADENVCWVKPKKLIVATGAQERILPFPGNDLPGVYGAGAIQTLMNVYGVSPAKRVLMIGAGNIGLIVSYQLLQAGVNIVGVVEAMPKVGGYWVHAAKIRRLGVPIFLQHTILRGIGDDCIKGAEISEIDESFQPKGDVKRIDCDTICLAVGLTPTTELLWEAGCKMRYVPELCGHVPLRDETMQTSVPGIWVAGDATGIEEASAAMIEGRIAGAAAAASLGYEPHNTKARIAGFHGRLAELRAGEVGEKILSGVAKTSLDQKDQKEAV